jgi:glutamate-1-semialdehyde 2,1-aminomutase
LKLLDGHPGEFAAVVIEAMNVCEPAPGYLAAVKEIAHGHGALLIFDEVITGFRFDPGGAQKLFGVVPDLAAFGKGLANGYPVSAVAGRAEIMRLMEEIFFSFTFGGETLSLAAALATMRKVLRTDATTKMAVMGRRLLDGVGRAIVAHDLADVLSLAGHPSWSFLLIKDAPPYTQWDIKTLFLQEMFAEGILTLGTHNMSLAHGSAEVDGLIAAYQRVLPRIRAALSERNLTEMLSCETLRPLFRVR